jgi:DNA-binding HxlR family transcriptional regulator
MSSGEGWKPVILYHLSNVGIMRFGELKRVMPNITQKMPTKQLRELERDGLVNRHRF